MNKILSQDEVDALLKSVKTPDTGAATPEAEEASAGPAPASASPQARRKTVSTKRATVYNFRRPDRVPKSMLRSLQLLYDKFCSNVSSSLSAYLRTTTEVTLLSVEQTSYNEFLLSLSDPTCYNAIGIKPLTGMAAFEMNLDLAFPLIDRLLGGTGNAPKLARNITDIERLLIQGVIKVILGNLHEAWGPVASIDFHLHASETRPQLLQIAAANEVVILIIFEVRMGDVRGNMHLCIPFAALEPIAANFEQDIGVRRKGVQVSDLKQIVKALHRTSVPVTAELTGTAVTVRELLSLKTGDVLRLDSKLAESLSVHVAGRPKFESHPLISDSQKAVRIVATMP